MDSVPQWLWDRVMYRTKKDANDRGCWEWQGRVDRDGYGRIDINGRIYNPHRLSYLRHHGPLIEGMVVMHACDNPPCCNPDHLSLGTDADNHRDRTEKGRGFIARGERNGSSKLTNDQVVEIRRLRAEGASSKALAERYAISTRLVQYVCAGGRWDHLERSTDDPSGASGLDQREVGSVPVPVVERLDDGDVVPGDRGESS